MKQTERYNNGLMRKHVEFCEYYITNGQNALKAALQAGYGTGNSKRTASLAWGLLRGNTRTAKLIQQYIKKRLSKVERKLEVGFEKKVEKLWHIADTCAPDDPQPFIDKTGRLVVKIADPRTAVSAISELNKMQGHHAAERHVTINLEADPDIIKMKEIMPGLIENHKQEY